MTVPSTQRTLSTPNVSGDAANDALHDLGLSQEQLHAVLMAGESERQARGPLEPPMAAGVAAWGTMVGQLRAVLVQFGWTTREHKGVPLVEHPHLGTAIVVATGNARTGQPWTPGELQPKHSKGPAFADLIAPAQPSLFDQDPPALIGGRLFFLLHHRASGLIRAELAEPKGYVLTERGRVMINGWSVRIVIEPLELGFPSSQAPESAPVGEVTVRVRPSSTAT